MAIQEGGRGKKWDARKTSKPQTIGVWLRRRYDSPEEVRADWERDQCGLPEYINHWNRIMRIPDLVLILKQREERARLGFIDLLTIDLRGQPRA